MPQIGLTELLIIAALAVLLFGSRLPGVGKALGSGIRNFKKGLSGGNDEGEASPLQVQATAEPQASSGSSTTAVKARVQMSNPPTSLAGSTPVTSTASSPRAQVVDIDGENQS